MSKHFEDKSLRQKAADIRIYVDGITHDFPGHPDAARVIVEGTRTAELADALAEAIDRFDEALNLFGGFS